MIEPPANTPTTDTPVAQPVPSTPAEPPADAAGWDGPSDWQRLPLRARRVFVYVSLLVAVLPTVIASMVAYENVSRHAWGWPAIGGLWLVAIAFALWVAYKRYHYTFWKLDADGFAVRRGRLWQWETRVPTSRVQHLDIKRGPLERSHRLASLVLHTAGTRLSAVSISGLDDADAERLRDHFSRQIDRQKTMTTPTPEAIVLQDADAQPERRLHPMSWLFVLIQQLKQFIVPIIALFLFGRGDRNDLWGLVAICILGAISIWQYYTYRFRIGEDSLQIRSGLLQRSLRQIPFARIHNVGLHQTLLHRIFGVAEVRLESAGGIKPEAEMRVLKLDDALALEALVRRRRGAAAADPGAATDTAAARADAAGQVLLQLGLADIVRVGLISNRGMIVIGGGLAALSQISPDLIDGIFEALAFGMFGVVDSYGRGHEAAAVIIMLLGFVAMIRLFSVVIAVLHYSGFRLEEHGRRLTLERGLLTRIRTSTPRKRIQSWTLREGMLHRLFRRRTLEVGTAVLDNGSHSQPRSLREVAPVATPERCEELIRHLMPQARWPLADWRPLHRWMGWRLFLPRLLMAAAAGAFAGYQAGWLGAALVSLWVPWAAYISWQDARHAGYAIDDTLIAIRSGWWTRQWRFAEIAKLQAIRIGQSPLERRLGMATLLLDTAGGSAAAEPLRLRFMPAAEARALHERLSREIARNLLRW